MADYRTLFDVFPRIKHKREIVEEVEGVKAYLNERGKVYSSTDELIFLAVLERHIKIFTKAKEMIANSRFTVTYMGPEYNDQPKITDFKIVPIDDG